MDGEEEDEPASADDGDVETSSALEDAEIDDEAEEFYLENAIREVSH